MKLILKCTDTQNIIYNGNLYSKAAVLFQVGLKEKTKNNKVNNSYQEMKISPDEKDIYKSTGKLKIFRNSQKSLVPSLLCVHINSN